MLRSSDAERFGRWTVPKIRTSADISACGRYRYRLTRHWDLDVRPLTFVLLNPSTADASVNDATVRRCMGLARREGAGGILVVNLYAFRSTSPRHLPLCPDADGPENVHYLEEVAEASRCTSSPIVCGWGTRGGDRGASIAAWMLRKGAHLVCLGLTGSGHPRHPLYVRSDQPLVAYAAWTP
jgi:hypothetical protein